MTRAVYRQAAAQDVADAYGWYESQVSGLGEAFLVAVGAAVDRAAMEPAAMLVVEPSQRIRRILVRRFLFAVYFRSEGERLVVLAVLHTARAPSVWQGRR